MKSYIEPLSAAEALDVLDLYGVDTPGAFPSTEHEGCVEVELGDHTVLLETPGSVKMLFGDDAAAALRHHANFRKDAVEITRQALDLDEFLYNVYSGEAFIPDTAPDGEFFGFHVAHIPLTAIVEEDVDPLSPDICDYGLDFINETNEDAAGEPIDLSGVCGRQVPPGTRGLRPAPPGIRIQMPDPARTGREREHRLQTPRHGTGQADRQLHPSDEALRRLRRRPDPRDRRRPGRRHGARDQARGHQHQLPGARRACPGRGAGHGPRGDHRGR